MRFRSKLCAVGAGVAIARTAPLAAAAETPRPIPHTIVGQKVGSDVAGSAEAGGFETKPKGTKYKPGKVARSAPKTTSLAPTGPGVGRLIRDFDGDRISPTEFVRIALTLQQRAAFPVPKKYSGTVRPKDLMVLGDRIATASQRLSQKQLTSIRAATANARTGAAEGSSRRLTAENVACYQHPAFSDRYVCDWETTHFKISWDYDGIYALAPDQLIDSDSNGVPEAVEALRAALDDAREFYISQGFGTDADPNDPTDDPPPDGISVEFSADPINGEGVSLPGDPFGIGSIGIPASAKVRYAAAHELFHQFQYSYATWSMITYANWFQEASAEWAAGRYLSAVEQGVPSPPYYARNTPIFLGEPSRRLNETDGLSGPRQYGALVFVDYFAWMYGQDFVKNVLAEFHEYGAQINEAEALENVAIGYDSNLSTDLTYYWWMMYTMCGDPGTIQSRPAARTTDPDPTSMDDQFAAYCNAYLGQVGAPTATTTAPGLSTPRPAHLSQTASDTSGTWDPTVGSGGAAFFDFADGASAHEQRRLTLTVTAPADFHGYLRLQPWNENPADPYSNYSCHSDGETWIDGAETVTITAKMNKFCPNATAMLVATNADSVVEVNRPGMSGDSEPWEGWSHARRYTQAVPA